MDIFHKILKQYWGYDEFRPLQEDIIHSVFQKRDTLGLMPTGGGKSLTFQVPAMAMEGLCLVVTPLIALMKDQVENLKDRGIKALSIYSGMTRQEIQTTLDNAIFGDYKFLYVSPERLATQLFLSRLDKMTISLLVVDESHCISQWGYDFRPSYLKIADIRQYIPGVPALALTATATPEVIDDIQNQLHFKEKNVFKKSFERNNLAYVVHNTENKEEELVNLIKRVKGSGIVYVRSRQKTKELSDFLSQQNVSVDYFHAGLTNTEKNRKLISWKENAIRVIVCTNAFGMGIDKPDVRFVIHMDLPNSIEEYFQEAGRAGRDGNKSYAIILYNKQDSAKLKRRIKNEFPERDFILHVYDSLAYFFQVAEGYGVGSIFDFNLHQFCKIYKLPILPTHNAMKILDLAGYIEYTDEIDNRSRLMFLVYRDDLYSYKFDKQYERLVNTTLRLYTGIFTNYATINEEEIAQRLETSRGDVYEMFKSLSKRRIIDYIPHKKTPLVAYKQPRIDTKFVLIPKAVNEDRKERFEKRIASMSNYAEQTIYCRSRLLLSYFGEESSSECGHCDVCRSRNKKGINNIEFDKISGRIRDLIQGGEAKEVEYIVNALKEYPSEIVIEVIRFMVDKSEIEITFNKIKLK
ncbi:ATP-dependent DNA helicase RecQ [Dysgonomonas sp. Marseille-P4361]|uniref:RecQ family ATP-dependent DNA helicase n=1 Tax=Dysgonomonas sp. Marseille-P4361 TaxID=2161820 RepID=UPI000D54E557|nr:ATP-dependent DNA helicase RecQ [Dysgonomonas sp. Marseille-P4361]